MTTVPELRLTLPGAVAAPPPFALSRGARLGPIALGSEGDWAIHAKGVPPVACYLLFDGEVLYVSALSAKVFVGEHLVGREWYRLAAPAEVRIGVATLSVLTGQQVATREARSAPALGPPPAVAKAMAAALSSADSPGELTLITPRQMAVPELPQGKPSKDKVRPPNAKRRRYGLVACAVLGVGVGGGLAGQNMYGDSFWWLRSHPAAQAPVRSSVTGETSTFPESAQLAQVPAPRPAQTAPASTQARQAPPEVPPPLGPAPLAPSRGRSAPRSPPKAEAPVPVPRDDPRQGEKTLEQQAVEAAARGDFGVASVIYDELARENPEVPAFAVAARILSERRH